jgi:hypothetical protein
MFISENLCTLRLRTDELAMNVAVQIRGAYAPSRAHFGASPKCFFFNQRKSLARRQRQHARARTLPGKEVSF